MGFSDPSGLLSKVEAALATGARSIAYAGNTLTFRSQADLMRLKARLERQLDPSLAPKRLVRTVYDRGA